MEVDGLNHGPHPLGVVRVEAAEMESDQTKVRYRGATTGSGETVICGHGDNGLRKSEA
jgi:hypothetical protein